ncbi:MAG: hypothetical protein ACR5KV_07235 [Wolbachia sp.]
MIQNDNIEDKSTIPAIKMIFYRKIQNPKVLTISNYKVVLLMKEKYSS